MQRAFWVAVVVVLSVSAAPAGAREPLTTRASIAQARKWAEARAGAPSFAVVTEAGKVRGLHVNRTYPAASMTKAMLMVAVLRAARGRDLTSTERAQLAPMIERSDNRAARALFAVHGPAALAQIARVARMRHFSIAQWLFEARITAADQARFFARIDRLVPRRHRAYARHLLSAVIPRERWGLPPAAEHHHLSVRFKGGWRSHTVHQAGLLERGRRRIAIAVLTDGPSMAYGEATIEGIAERVLSPPARKRARFRPGR